MVMNVQYNVSLHWRHNEHNGVSNHWSLDCLLKRLFRRRSKKTPKLRFAGLCEGNSLGTGEFPSQRVRNTENVSIWGRHHVFENYTNIYHLTWTTPEDEGLRECNTTKTPLVTSPSVLNPQCRPWHVNVMLYHVYPGYLVTYYDLWHQYQYLCSWWSIVVSGSCHFIGSTLANPHSLKQGPKWTPCWTPLTT